DQPPDADVQPDVVRKTRDGYMVTAVARIPFTGKVRDDNGLAAVRYAWTAARVEAGTVNAKPLDAVSVVPLVAGGRTPVLAAALLTAVGAGPRPTQTQYFPLPRFGDDLRQRRDEFLPIQAIRENLVKKEKLPYRTLLKEFDLKPDVLLTNNAESDPVANDFPLR